MKTSHKLTIFFVLIALIILARFLPHWPNVVPVTAVALLVGAYLNRYWAGGVVLLGMIISDWLIGFYHWPVMLSVYGSFLIIAFLGGLLMKYKSPKIVLIYSLGSSFIFYLVTNFAVWASASWYTKNLSGLWLAYEMGLPFLRYTILGDLFYTVALFSAAEIIKWFVNYQTKVTQSEKKPLIYN